MMGMINRFFSDHLLLVGPPGTGKTLYARRLVDQAPFELAEPYRADQEYIGRVAGLPLRASGLSTCMPFRVPHHTVSELGMFGMLKEKWRWHPGEVSLAHGGVLWLDDLPEFRASLLTRLLAVMQSRVVLATPAVFRLVATANPCPCGWYGSSARVCSCPPAAIERYTDRLKPFFEVCRVLREPDYQSELERNA